MIYKIIQFCYWYLNPYWWIKPYFISFVEEAVLNPDYKGYVGGRMEVWTQWSSYDIDEFRFLTKNLREFDEFREKWDFKDVSWWQLQRIKKHLRDNFYKLTN